MSQLYTITIKRLRLACLDDGTIAETVVTQTMGGMPPALVETWKRDFPLAFVSAVPEEAHYDKRGSRPPSSGERPGFARRQQAAKPSAVPAPAGTDLGSLINQQLRQ